PGLPLVRRRETAQRRGVAELSMTRVRSVCGVAVLLAACAGTARYPPSAPAAPPTEVAQLTAVADRIAATSAQSPDVAWLRLAELVDLHGPRITGSAALAQALDWSAARMRDDGLDAVRLEPVDVPHWVRGVESGRIVRPVDRPLAILALGGSVGTHGTLR